MQKQRLAVVGGGQMGRALVCGMLDNQVIHDADVVIVDHNVASRQWWGENRPDVSVCPDLNEAVKDADTVLLAVKPKVIGKVAQQSESL
ncbi:pyrroline-5-carboxylate reductase, partial [Rhodopirellula maiorica SM1]